MPLFPQSKPHQFCPTLSLFIGVSLLLTSSWSVVPPVQALPTDYPLMAQNTWQPFFSSEGRFSVEMPGQPQIDTFTNDNGSTEYSFSLEVANPLSHYFIHHFDEPKLAAGTEEELEELLNITLQAFIDGAEGELLSQENIQLNRYPGKSFEFSLGIPQAPTGKGNIFVVNDRVYILIVFSPNSQDARRFLNSFKLLETQNLTEERERGR